MDEVDFKLRRAYEIIARSGGDSDLLGAALLALHGALETYFHLMLDDAPRLSAADRQLLDRPDVGWLTLVDLMIKAGELSADQRRLLLDLNALRREFAHGAPFGGSVGDLLRYARAAAAICERPGLFEQTLIAWRRSRAEAADELPPPLRGPAPAPATSGIPLVRLVLIAVILGALALGIRFVVERPETGTLLNAIGIGAPGRGLPPPAPTAAPTPSPRQAQIVRLGAGPGWLHVAPSFDSGTQPIPLSEGMLVTLLGEEQVGQDGTRWLRVAINGYDGWCPANNLEFTFQ